MFRLLARGVPLAYLLFFERLKCPQVVRKPVHFILLPDRPSNYAARIEVDFKAREIQLT